jgi:pyruvate dehydrogenase E1 component
LAVEERLLAILRWNAIAMVVKANKISEGIGGHIGTYQSVAWLFEVGLNHFFKAAGEQGGGDLVFFQGHASPGIYARAFLEGRLDANQLENFRREVGGQGLPSYPHPWLLPDFWQFATVSMGLGPLLAIYQARFMKYLDHRGLVEAEGRRVWAFLGDGEMDEPESLGALSIAARERLDNLTFVINCNLQRLDGPVRGNSKIIQELEGIFRGAGWHVIKVLWGTAWDALFAADTEGHLQRRLLEVVDGEYQNYASPGGGAYFREHFFGASEALLKMVAHLSDDELMDLARARGGHDPRKIYAAYKAASDHRGQPTVILAHTVKGYGLGEAGEAANIAHNVKKIKAEQLRTIRDRFTIPVNDEEIENLSLLKPPSSSPELTYLGSRRQALGGPFPQRSKATTALELPDLDAYSKILEGTGKKEASTTMVFRDILQRVLIRAKGLKKHLVPILADEARTFGMEGLFQQLGIYAPSGQLYKPMDAEQVMPYKESKNGQILQEGICEAGAISSWTAAGMSYSTHGVPMIPFFIYYSIFGFQRVGDSIWAAADMGARGFLIGGTSGRTTLNGEGLQHEDGHSHVVASTVPNCVAYDPTYGYEVAVIIHDGLRRMYGEQPEDIFYYITTLNEDYAHPAMPSGAEEGIRRGMYLLRRSGSPNKRKRVQLFGCGSILREVEAAAEILEQKYDVAADVWSITSFTELRREGLTKERYNLLHPEEKPQQSYVETALEGQAGPVIAATDYMRTFADQIRPFVKRSYSVLGTDGFGRSDSREALRAHFEVDRRWVTLAALKALADEGTLPASQVSRALDELEIDPEKLEPVTV